MLPRFRFATPLLLTAVFHLAGFGAGRLIPAVAGERFFAGCVSRSAPSAPSVCQLGVPAFSECCPLIWFNHTEDFDTRPYFVRFPVIPYGYQSLISGERIIYRSDGARRWPPGRPAFDAAQRPWLSLRRGVSPFELRRDTAPAAESPAAPPHRPIPMAFPIVVRNPFAEQDRAAHQSDGEGFPAVGGGKVTIFWETSEAIRPLRIANPHVQSEP